MSESLLAKPPQSRLSIAERKRLKKAKTTTTTGPKSHRAKPTRRAAFLPPGCRACCGGES